MAGSDQCHVGKCQLRVEALRGVTPPLFLQLSRHVNNDTLVVTSSDEGIVCYAARLQQRLTNTPSPCVT